MQKKTPLSHPCAVSGTTQLFSAAEKTFRMNLCPVPDEKAVRDTHSTHGWLNQ